MICKISIRMKKGGSRSKTQKRSSLSKKRGLVSTMRKRKTKPRNNINNIIRNMETAEENPFEYLSNASIFLEKISSKTSNVLNAPNHSYKLYNKLSIIASIVAGQIAATLKKHSHILQTKVSSFNTMNIESDTKDAMRQIYLDLINEDLATENPFEYIEDLKDNLNKLIDLYNTAIKEDNSDLEIQLTLFAIFLQEDIKHSINLAKIALPSTSNNNMNVNSNINMKSTTTSSSSSSSRSSKSSKSSASSVGDLADLFSSVLSKSFGKA